MSSTKHQPNLRKRPHSEVEPEFPSIPILSFVAAQEFAGKSQEALLSVQQGLSATFPGSSSIFLPLISPHQLQQRFKVKENSVFVVVRKSYTLLKDDVLSLNLEDCCGLYVRGPVGVGKSYLLYLLAAEYRLNRQSYRVTYINDCAEWRDDKFGLILREFVTTFHDDIINSKSIVEWCDAVIGSEKEERMMMMMIALVNYVRENTLQWIVICDQHNALFNPPVVKEFPFNLISFLSMKRCSNIKVIISASANNEGYPTEMKGWQTHDISSHRFDEDEFKVWCDHYRLENIVNHESEEAVDALYWTGGVPYELDLLWKQPDKTLVGKTMMYRRERARDMMESHGKFFDKLSDEKKFNLKECISRMALGLSPPKGLIGMDRQLFDIMLDIDNIYIITALNPIARDALIAYHGKVLVNSLGLVADIVFNGDYTNDVKGRIVEKYIITMLELSQRFSFTSYKTTSTGLSTVNPVRKMFEIKDIIHFSGNKLPPKHLFNQRVITLFIPKSSNYPGLDYFIWNPRDLVLMAFQVTVKNPFTSHPKIDGASENCKRWLDFCFSGSETEMKPLEVYWIIPDSCVGKPKNFKDRVILVRDLWADFPALQKLSVQ